MSFLPDLPARAFLLSLFADSPIGMHLGPRASLLFNLGSVQRLQPGQSLSNMGAYPVHMVLAGRLSCGGDWWGPGNHFAARGPVRQALDSDTLVWSLDTSQAVWRSDGAEPLRNAWADALRGAMEAEVAALPPYTLPDPNTLCNHRHPAVAELARTLRRGSPADSAETIFHFVQGMPYRFGLWQELASDTLERGTGMCTTKANLQVALLRALGIEAGFVEVPLEMGTLGALLPDGWRALMRTRVKHYFAAVRLDGRWHAADASFCNPSCSLFIDAEPRLAAMVPAWFQAERPFHPVAHINGSDPFDIRVVPEMSAEMGKKSCFLPRHFEAMNTRLDRATLRHPLGRAVPTAAPQHTPAAGESAPS